MWKSVPPESVESNKWIVIQHLRLNRKHNQMEYYTIYWINQATKLFPFSNTPPQRVTVFPTCCFGTNTSPLLWHSALSAFHIPSLQSPPTFSPPSALPCLHFHLHLEPRTALHPPHSPQSHHLDPSLPHALFPPPVPTILSMLISKPPHLDSPMVQQRSWVSPLLITANKSDSYELQTPSFFNPIWDSDINF